jgi:hypothetical protein
MPISPQRANGYQPVVKAALADPINRWSACDQRPLRVPETLTPSFPEILAH